jgi:hypothetical protein
MRLLIEVTTTKSEAVGVWPGKSVSVMSSVRPSDEIWVDGVKMSEQAFNQLSCADRPAN